MLKGMDTVVGIGGKSTLDSRFDANGFTGAVDDIGGYAAVIGSLFVLSTPPFFEAEMSDVGSDPDFVAVAVVVDKAQLLKLPFLAS